MFKSCKKEAPPAWYIAGLAFECQGCGKCCAGPQEGYVWVSDEEIDKISDFLEMEREDFIKRYVRKTRRKQCLIEHPSHDCIFLKSGKCRIYSVRPSQCKTWPFWSSNLQTPADWCEAGDRCCGMNRGKIVSAEQIEQIIHNEPE